MTKHCQSCVYHMNGNPPVCNALHTPIAGEIDCVDWQTNEARSGCLTPDGLYLRERLDQGQVPIAEIIQRQRSEQVERWREAFERGDPFGDLPEITHDPRGNLRLDRVDGREQESRSTANVSRSESVASEPYETRWRNYLSIECLGAIEEAVRSQVDLLPDHLQHLVFHNRNLLPSFFRLASQYVTIPHPEYWENDRLVELAEREAMRQSQVDQSFGYEIQESIEARRAAIARDAQRRADENESLGEYYRIDRSSPAIAVSELRAMCARHLNPFRDGQELHARSQSTGRLIEFIAIATPNGLKWQYQGAVIID